MAVITGQIVSEIWPGNERERMGDNSSILLWPSKFNRNHKYFDLPQSFLDMNYIVYQILSHCFVFFPSYGRARDI